MTVKLLYLTFILNPSYFIEARNILDQLSAPTAPSCQPPQGSDSLISWKSCGLDKNAWYGITKYSQTVAGAVDTCKSVGGELVYIENETTDQCSYYAMSLSGLTNELVIFSGRYFVALNNWAWCPAYKPGTQIEEGCVGVIDEGSYQNWSNDGSQGDCMGGLIYGGASSFYDYGWEKRSCGLIDSERLKALCRLDCDAQQSD